MLIVCKYILLPDAEVGEDLGEDVGGGDAAGDFAQVVHALADVLAHEVATDALAQAVDGAGYGLAGLAQCLVVAGICDYYLAEVVVGQRSSVAVYWGNQYTHPVAWKRKLRYMECLMSVNVTYNRLPDNHTLVVLTAGGYVV